MTNPKQRAALHWRCLATDAEDPDTDGNCAMHFTLQHNQTGHVFVVSVSGPADSMPGLFMEALRAAAHRLDRVLKISPRLETAAAHSLH